MAARKKRASGNLAQVAFFVGRGFFFSKVMDFAPGTAYDSQGMPHGEFTSYGEDA
jgi:hypothetical protein